MLSLNTNLIKTPLFNPESLDSDTPILDGDVTNLNNFSNIKFKWAWSLYKKQREDLWTPEIVNLSQDKLSDLAPEEREATDDELGFLVFLDSLQTSNLPHLSVYVTNPEIKACLIEQTSQELLHSDSYQTIFTTIYTKEDADKVYYKFKENSELYDRVQFITRIYQDFIDFPNMRNFIRVLVANLYLEGVYFYVGFAFFYHLAHMNKLVGVSSIIRLINIDEKGHIGIFVGMLNEIRKDANVDLVKFIEETVMDLGEEVRKRELKWSLHILRNIPEFVDSEVEQYIDYLIASNVQRPLGYDVELPRNPFKHLELIANVDKGSNNKGNAFESNASTYSQTSALSGFSEF